MEEIKILEIARGYLGQDEVRGNLGFQDPAFEEKMRTVGWQPPWAWCAMFATLVMREAYGQMNSYIENDLRTLMSPSATAVYNNFKGSPKYKQYVDKKPTKGALIVWQYGNGWQGHIGIVEEVNGDKMVCIEGNTNSQGGREGIEVSRQKRRVDYMRKAKGLNLMGFIHPPKIDNHV